MTKQKEKMNQPGLLLTFEGIDGSGKSTQATMLFHRLLKEGYNALLVREPGGTSISEKIRDVLLDIKHQNMADTTELLLYAASRAQLVAEKIKPHIDDGVIVLCDRYTDSSLAYQGYGRGLNTEFIKNLNALATQETVPDLTFVIDVDLATAAKRASVDDPDRMESEKNAFKKRVQNGYHAIAEQEPARVVLIPGEEEVDALHEKIWELTIPKLELLKTSKDQ